MKPKPRVVLKNFTVPVAISVIVPCKVPRRAARQRVKAIANVGNSYWTSYLDTISAGPVT
jgi:hypothetical protein